MKKILVPTDFSGEATNALNFAVQVAAKINAEIILLHALEIERPNFQVSGEISAVNRDIHFQAEIISRCLHKLQEIAQQYPNTAIITKATAGDAEEVIQKAVEHYETDLVVMGSKGVKGWKELLVGSQTEKIIRYVKCPVLVVKQPMDLNFLESILLACDLTEESIPVVNKVVALGQVLELKIDILYVHSWRDYTKNEMGLQEEVSTFLQKTNANQCDVNIISHDNIEKAIISVADKLDSGIVAMATHGRKGLVHFLTGSLTEDFANHSKRPVLSVLS